MKFYLPLFYLSTRHLKIAVSILHVVVVNKNL
jgi:hypothetical protein